MSEIITIQKNKVFNYSQAVDLLPLIYRLTEDSSKQVKYLMSCVDALQNKNCETSLNLQERINLIIEKWQNKLERLGVKPKGLWLADFDNGQGYFCWKYPETQILFEHGYQDGFTGRILLREEDSHENSHSPN